MNSLDWAVLIGYFGVMVVIGVWSHKRVDNVSDFFTAGGKMPWWLSGISHHMSGYSAVMFVAFAAVAYEHGLTVYVWWALTSAMYSLARELGPHRIRVNTVLPGWMWGPPVQAYVQFTAQTEGVPEADVLKRLSERMALPELATDSDVADAAVFLASDRARAITGQSLLVNAGELMR